MPSLLLGSIRTINVNGEEEVMAQRIRTVPPEEAKGLRKILVSMTKRQTGGMVPGIQQVLMTDLKIMFPTYWLYNYLNMRKASPMTRLQREMLATVVNGLIGGAP